jgi:hypothetical protein
MAGISPDSIKEIISSWRLHIKAHENSIATGAIYEQMGPTGHVSGAEVGKLINQAHINQLVADIQDIERLLP